MAEQTPTGFDRAIADYYERASEESRLEHGAFRLEEARTRELIERHAPPAPADVLDVGGAAGAYALWLAERGYVVHLLDATPRLVEEARRRSARGARGLASCRVADARALPVPDESVALVLLLGPLYHLVEPGDRRRALLEARRVLRPGGVLVAAGISRWASALDGLARDLLADERFARIVERDLRDGQHRNPTERLDYFTTAYFHRPAELRAEVEEAGLTVEGPYGIEGPGWILPDLVERWNDPERRATLLHVARLLEAEPAVLGCSAHLLVVGRKPPSGEADRVPVPVELRTERLLLRPWRADDAASLHPVLVANETHLGPWIPAQVAEPVPLPELEHRLARFAADFLAAREWRYGLFTPDGRGVVGEVGLYPRDAEGRVPYASADRVEIGYWLRADRTGQGLATEAVRTVLAVAAGLPRLTHAEIRCDARNAASAAIPRRLGFRLATTIRQPTVGAAPPIDLQLWTRSLHGAAAGESDAPGRESPRG